MFSGLLRWSHVQCVFSWRWRGAIWNSKLLGKELKERLVQCHVLQPLAKDFAGVTCTDDSQAGSQKQDRGSGRPYAMAYWRRLCTYQHYIGCFSPLEDLSVFPRNWQLPNSISLHVVVACGGHAHQGMFICASTKITSLARNAECSIWKIVGKYW